MKKILLVLMLTIATGVLLSSCASRRGVGCPSHNPKYFRA